MELIEFKINFTGLRLLYLNLLNVKSQSVLQIQIQLGNA